MTRETVMARRRKENPGLLTTCYMHLALKQNGTPVSERRLRVLHAKGHGHDKLRPFLFPPLEEFLASLVAKTPCTEFLGTDGPWARFKRGGWAANSCNACGRHGPLGTVNYNRLGDHVMARRLGPHDVLVHCCCSNKIGALEKLLVPQADLGKIPA